MTINFNYVTILTINEMIIRCYFLKNKFQLTFFFFLHFVLQINMVNFIHQIQCAITFDFVLVLGLLKSFTLKACFSAKFRLGTVAKLQGTRTHSIISISFFSVSPYKNIASFHINPIFLGLI